MTPGDAILKTGFDGTVIIVCPSWVGDTIMATPVYRALRAGRPAARLVALVRPGLDDILEGCSWFDEVVVARGGGVGGAWRLSRVAARAKPRAAVLLPNSFGSALGVFLGRVPVRVGYARDGRGWMLTHPIAVEKRATPQSMVPYYARIALAVLGVDSIDERVELACSEAQRETAKRVAGDVDGPLVVLNPGANRADKRWPAKRFAQVGDALIESHDATIAVTGSPAEREVVEGVIAAASHKDRFINLVDRGLTLGALKAIIEGAALLITNDTGPRHIAIAMGTPVVSLFGPTDYRWTCIAGAIERALLAEPFLPEELIADDHAKRCSIDRIATGDVIHAARQLLDASAAAPVSEPHPESAARHA